LELAEARAQVRGPAIGLLVTGIIHCVAFPLVLLLALLSIFWRNAAQSDAVPFGFGEPPAWINDPLDRTTGVIPGAGRDGLSMAGTEMMRIQNRRNPFGIDDVADPDGADVKEFAELVIDGDSDNANAGHWTDDTFPGHPDSLEGEWASRWNGGTAGTEWIAGTATVKTVGDRVYILHRDRRQTFLIDAHRAANNRLVGRHVNVDIPADAFPWVGRIVDSERIDGEWAHGRFDLRRKLAGSTERDDRTADPPEESKPPDRGGDR
jgi:hypothetical protein